MLSERRAEFTVSSCWRRSLVTQRSLVISFRRTPSSQQLSLKPLSIAFTRNSVMAVHISQCSWHAVRLGLCECKWHLLMGWSFPPVFHVFISLSTRGYVCYHESQYHKAILSGSMYTDRLNSAQMCLLCLCTSVIMRLPLLKFKSNHSTRQWVWCPLSNL